MFSRRVRSQGALELLDLGGADFLRSLRGSGVLARTTNHLSSLTSALNPLETCCIEPPADQRLAQYMLDIGGHLHNRPQHPIPERLTGRLTGQPRQPLADHRRDHPPLRQPFAHRRPERLSGGLRQRRSIGHQDVDHQVESPVLDGGLPRRERGAVWIRLQADPVRQKVLGPGAKASPTGRRRASERERYTEVAQRLVNQCECLAERPVSSRGKVLVGERVDEEIYGLVRPYATKKLRQIGSADRGRATDQRQEGAATERRGEVEPSLARTPLRRAEPAAGFGEGALEQAGARARERFARRVLEDGNHEREQERIVGCDVQARRLDGAHPFRGIDAAVREERLGLIGGEGLKGIALRFAHSVGFVEIVPGGDEDVEGVGAEQQGTKQPGKFGLALGPSLQLVPRVDEHDDAALLRACLPPLLFVDLVGAQRDDQVPHLGRHGFQAVEPGDVEQRAGARLGVGEQSDLELASERGLAAAGRPPDEVGGAYAILARLEAFGERVEAESLGETFEVLAAAAQGGW